jgi:hypothetical protein
MPTKYISINRAPVLTLWAAVIAQRLGFTEDEALSLGKALAGLNAQAKGRSLGIFKPHEEKPKKAPEKERGEEFWIELCGRPVPAKNTDDGTTPDLAENAAGAGGQLRTQGGHIHTQHTHERQQQIALVPQMLSGRPRWPVPFGDRYPQAGVLQQAYCFR